MTRHEDTPDGRTAPETEATESPAGDPAVARRGLLRAGAALGTAGLLPTVTGADGTADEAETVPDGTEFENLVGAYYYGWYVPEENHHWEGDLDTPDGRSHTPTLGEYSSHDQAVVDQHIAWALQHGINWFNCTWWGPDTNAEVTILDYLLESQYADKMQFSLLYEPLGRDIGDWADFGDAAVRERLREDLQYAERTFFDDPNWLHVDGRPVVYFWINRQFTGDVTGAFEDAIATLDTDPYLVGDNVTHAEPFDAVANFATVGAETSDWNTYVEHTRGRREQRQKVTTYGTDQTHIPSVQPGASWPDPILEHDADRFREVCRVMAEAMDEDLQAAIVCSFNEWHEGSTLEPAEEYGTSALAVVADELQGASVDGPWLDGEYARVRFEFSDVVRPAEVSDSGDVRPLAFWLDAVRLEAEDGTEVLAEEVVPSTDAAYQTTPAIAGISGQWLGTPLGVGSLVFERSDLVAADTLVLRGHALEEIDDLTADVSVNGEAVGTVGLGSTNQEYEVPVPEAIPEHPDEPTREERPTDGLRAVDDATVRAVWTPEFDVPWPDYVYLGYAVDGQPRTWERTTQTAENRFEATVGGFAPGDEIDYRFSYYEDGWQATDGGTYTFRPDGPGTNRLVANGENDLAPGESLESATGDYRLYFQAADGNLVLRETRTGDARWASGTAGDGATRLTLQRDGNLVLYTDGGDAVWASDTAGSSASELLLAEDGRLVLTDGETTVWTATD